MGRFVNPDSSAFQVALNSRIYVDKTGLIEYTNSVLDTTNAYICNSRPRRFGKSYAANMLAAYYKHREEKTIRQYEYENFLYEYKAYKALRGNSFIERIAREVAEWEIVT